jgi:hypothetical protein
MYQLVNGYAVVLKTFLRRRFLLALSGLKIFARLQKKHPLLLHIKVFGQGVVSHAVLAPASLQFYANSS